MIEDCFPILYSYVCVEMCRKYKTERVQYDLFVSSLLEVIRFRIQLDPIEVYSTPDFKSSMRGSLIHDALYQLMRMNKLGIEWRPRVDDLLMYCLIADGMPRWLARIYWLAVRLFARNRATPQSERLPRLVSAP